MNATCETGAPISSTASSLIRRSLTRPATPRGRAVTGDGEVDLRDCGDADRAARCNSGDDQLTALTDVLDHDVLDEVMRNRRCDNQQESRRRRECGRESSGRNQGYDPGGKIGDFRVGQHHDVIVDLDHLVHALISAVLDQAVTVLVLKLEQTGGLPVREPLGTLFDDQALTVFTTQRVDQVQTSHTGNCGSSGVKNRDEHQSPTR